MEGIEYIYELCEALPRSGPGDNKSTLRAYQTITEPPAAPDILDIGCGQGMQTIALADISKGTITAIDNHKPFLDILMKNAAAQKVAERIIPKQMSMLEMDFEEKSFDIIWSEGALYIMGFQDGLKRCRQLLKERGHVAVTEFVYTDPSPPAPVVEFCEAEYPDINHIDKNIEIIKREGFSLISHFTLPESAWLNNYFLPIEKELPRLMNKYKGNEIALTVFEGFKNEVETYKTYSGYYGYEFYVMQKI